MTNDNQMENNITAPEQSPPIFSVSLAFTGTQLVVDTNQLNVLASATEDGKELINQIDEKLRDTYQQVTPLFEQLLVSLFGDNLQKNEMRSVSESTIFYVGGEESGG